MSASYKRIFLCLLSVLLAGGFAFAQASAAKEGEPEEAKTEPAEKPKPKEPEKKKPDFPPIDEVTKDSEKMEGFLTLYKKKEILYAEIPSSKFDKPFMLSVSIARGVGQGMVVAGMTLSEMPLYWKLSGKHMFLVEKNVRHTAPKSSPISAAVEEGFSDSVIAALTIRGKTGSNYLINLADFLFTDYANIGRQLALSVGGSYRLDKNRTTWGSIKPFPQNLSIEVAATYTGGSRGDIRTVPDSRALPVTLHYGFSNLPKTGYKARLADERMGHFLTAVKDYSKKGPEEPFVRHINRWNLKKADPKAELSPPKKPIVFYIEKSIPYEYRPIVREGILEWNKAFEKAGFINAIEVRYQEEDATWDAEDVRYNTVRWMTGEATYAIGPSRVNPETGEIYDADILVASSWLQYFDRQYQIFFDDDSGAWPDSPLDPQRQGITVEEYVKGLRRHRPPLDAESDLNRLQRCEFAQGIRQQLAIASMAALENEEEEEPKNGVPREYIRQALKELIMHEVGHTLGLRHNFKASSAIAMEDLNDKELIAKTGLSGSVMDYSLVNIAPKGVEQGYYFTPTLGSWDYLAIEYAYKEISGDGEGELKELQKIAALAAEAQYAYATDEDVSLDIDPLANRRDMSSDPLAFAKQRTEVISGLWDGLVERVTNEGEGYQKARIAFLYAVADKQQSLHFASRYIGGIYVHRNHRGDPGERPVLEVVPYEKQIEALDFVCEQALSDKAFDFDPEMLARLAPNRWRHWGSRNPSQMDVPIHDMILRGQLMILGRLFSARVLSRISDAGLYVKAGDDIFTIANLYRTITGAIWSELDEDIRGAEWSGKNPFVSSYRRNLQRSYLKFFLLEDVLNPWPGLPQDARSVAWATLTKLKQNVDDLIEELDAATGVELDALTDAHLRESQVRMEKALDAAFSVRNY